MVFKRGLGEDEAVPCGGTVSMSAERTMERQAGVFCAELCHCDGCQRVMSLASKERGRQQGSGDAERVHNSVVRNEEHRVTV